MWVFNCLGRSGWFGQYWNCPKGKAKVCFFWGCFFQLFRVKIFLEIKKYIYFSIRTKKLHYIIWKVTSFCHFFYLLGLQSHSIWFYKKICNFSSTLVLIYVAKRSWILVKKMLTLFVSSRILITKQNVRI